MLQFILIVGGQMLLLYILLILIIFAGIIGVIYLSSVSLLKNNLYRINEAEYLIEEILKDKLELITRANNILQKKTDLNIDMFGEVDKLKLNTNYIQVDRKLSSFYNTIIQIKSDYKSLEDNRSINEIIKEIKNDDEKLEAAKTFYNQYTRKLNELKSNIFYKLIFKIIKIKNYQLYNTKKTNEEIIDIDNL